jgi:ABC-type multidrug transport system permease subunit
MAGASPLLALSAARIKEFFREPGVIFWTFGFPLLITVALGIAFRAEGPPRAAVGLVESPAAPALAAALRADASLVVRLMPAEQVAARLRAGDVLLVIEPWEKIAAGVRVPVPVAPSDRSRPPVSLVYRFDPARPDALAIRRQVDDLIQRAAGRSNLVTTRDETAMARGSRYIDWLVPGLLGMQLLSGALWGTAYTIVNARQRKLLKRLAATPMRRRHYLLSFRVSGLLFVPLQVLVLFAFARLTFGVTTYGSPVAVLFLSLLGSWSFAGLGLLCASRARNNETANGLVNLVTLPMFMLSGVFFSSARFPAFLRPVIGLLPLTAFNDALRHIVNDGASFFAQGRSLVVLVIWGVVSAAVALRLFRWV